MQNYPSVDIINPTDTNIFLDKYLHKKPVIVKGFFKNSEVAKKWNEKYFLTVSGDKMVEVTDCLDEKYTTIVMKLKEYLKWLIEDQKIDTKKNNSLRNKIFYIHNSHLEKINNALLQDIDFKPEIFVGKWFLKNWKRNLFIFYGNKNSVTQLHYDGLGAHNTFFQIKGHKKFILIPANQMEYCYVTTKKTTRSKVDFENPDYQQYPLFKNVTPVQAFLEGGDILYMPPYTLHYVKGLDLNISVNIDWHTHRSVISSFFSGRAKKFKYHYWNILILLGLLCGIPNNLVFPLYKSYYD